MTLEKQQFDVGYQRQRIRLLLGKATTKEVKVWLRTKAEELWGKIENQEEEDDE